MLVPIVISYKPCVKIRIRDTPPILASLASTIVNQATKGMLVLLIAESITVDSFPCRSWRPVNRPDLTDLVGSTVLNSL